MSVIDLSGKTIETGDPTQVPRLVKALKALIDKLENSALTADEFYLITPDFSLDSGLTAQAAITMLLREQFRILCMLDGIKAG